MTYKKALDLSYTAGVRTLVTFVIGNIFLYLFVIILEANLLAGIIMYNIVLIPILIIVYKLTLVNIEVTYKNDKENETC